VSAARERPQGDRRARFTLPEVTEVLARFELGPIRRATEYPAGSRKAPKLLLETEAGRFLLKRRAIARHPLPRIRFGQELQRTLERFRFPVAGLVPLRGGDETLLIREGNAYELFRFVEGIRFDRSDDSCMQAGETAALLHRYLAGHSADGLEPASFHGSPTVITALRTAAASVASVDPSVDLAGIEAGVRSLGIAYAEASARVEAEGFSGLPTVTVHGDFHPGNLLYALGRVAAVLDFDSARLEPRVVEVANGMLQFSQPGRRGVSPLEWPAKLDRVRLRAFLVGYSAATDTPLTPAERTMLPWLMIEAMVAESIIPIANTGSFADLPAGPFLAMVARKCAWVRERADRLTAA
jgi:Ser/Thr protein kinase RdoA (MazF antagonist)